MKIPILVFFISIIPFDVFAYADPGSSAFILQAIVAFLGGMLIFFKNIINQIKNIIKKINMKFTSKTKK